MAVEYISAIKKLKSKITPVCIKRNNDLPTASTLRKSIVPKITNDDFSSILNYKLQLAKSNLCDYSNTYLMTNDLYNAILKTADKNISFTKRAKLLKTKNVTLSHIKRVLLNIVLGINKNTTLVSKNNPKINYMRILGIKKDFLPNLKYLSIPFLLSYNNNAYKTFVNKFKKSNAVKINKNGDYILSPSIKTNIFASDLYNFLSNNKTNEASTKALII